MSKYYDEALIPAELRRNFDVYDRIRALQLPLGSFETDVVSLANAGIAGAVIHESGPGLPVRHHRWHLAPCTTTKSASSTARTVPGR